MSIEQQLPALGDEEVFDLQLTRRGGRLLLRHEGLPVPHDAPGLRAILTYLQGMQSFRGKITEEEKAASQALNTRLCAGDGPDFPLHVGLHEAASYQPPVYAMPQSEPLTGPGPSPEEPQVA